MPQLDAILHGLRIFLRPGQVAELRAIHVAGRRAVTRVFADVAAMAARAAEIDQAGARGIYFTPNPLRPDLVGSQASARKGDVLARHWLLVDVDPIRPADVSSTAEERAAAWAVLDGCRGALDGAGLEGAVIGDSGNGWHLCYPIEMPNDDAAQELLKAVLRGLQDRYGASLTQKEMKAVKEGAKALDGPQAAVGVECHDAVRIWKLYGTRARKGEPTAERPHRLTRIVEGVPWEASTARQNVARLSTLLGAWQWAEERRRGRPETTQASYAAAALRAECEAVAGESPGNRNNRLNEAALKLGSLVGAGALSRGEVETALVDAARRAGLEPGETTATLRSGIEAGIRSPRDLSSLNNTPDNGFGIPFRNGNKPNTESRGKKVADNFDEPIPASQLRADEKAAWLWKGYLGRGAVTLMSALWKSGKTTLLSHLLKAAERGGEFCGQQLDPATILYSTEESEARWAGRRDRLGLTDHVEFLIRPFRGKPDNARWGEFLDHLGSLQAKRNYDLLIFDTLADLWPVKDENDASAVIGALKPLHAAMGKASLFLIHHNRKGDGTEATASRGSGALTAFVDTILELRRYAPDDKQDRRRVLTAYGRDDDTPQEVVIELSEDGHYSVQGSRAESRSTDLSQQILALLPTEPRASRSMKSWTSGQAIAKPQRRSIFSALSTGAEQGAWVRGGEGVRGNPHRYWHHVPGEVFQ